VLLEPPLAEAQPTTADSDLGYEDLVGLRVYSDEAVPIDAGTAAFATKAKRLAADLVPYLRGAPTRVVPPAPRAGPVVCLCPSSGSKEEARVDLLNDLVHQDPPLAVTSVGPSAGDLVETLRVAEEAIHAADVSVHFFGESPAWRIGESALCELLLTRALAEVKRRDHRVIAWVAQGSPLERAVAQALSATDVPPARVRLCIGTRDDLRRQVLAVLEQAGVPEGGERLLVAGAVEVVEVRAALLRAGVGIDAVVSLPAGRPLALALPELLKDRAVGEVVLALPGGAPNSALLPTLRRLKEHHRLPGRWGLWTVGTDAHGPVWL
jgi:hypothetical protein